MDRRKQSLSKSSPLPKDYASMVNEVFNGHFETSLKIFNQLKPNSRFETTGEIFGDEVLVAITLVSKGAVSATTVYASSDFDPKASSPNIQEILSACIDAIGTVFNTVLVPENPEMINQIAGESLSTLEGVPFEWTEIEADKKQIFVRVDKTNPKLESFADEWLAKNDPEYKERVNQEQSETENLFVTGKPKKVKVGSGIVH